MIFLLNTSEKKYELTLTKNPITNPQQSPTPTGKRVEDANDAIEKESILTHRNYSEAEVVYLRPGLNKFENDEWAEYFYMTLGNPEDAGAVPVGQHNWVPVKNRNFVLEVTGEPNDKGEYKEVKDHFFKKYRSPVGAQTVTHINESLYNLKKD